MECVHEETIVIGLAAVMGGVTTFMLVAGIVVSPIFFLFSLPFAGATYVMWQHATGRLDFERARAAATSGVRSGSAGSDVGDGAGFDRERRAERNRRRARRTRRSRGPGPDARTDGATTGTGARTGKATTPGTTGPSRREASRTLGVDPDASPTAVKRAYRRRVKEAHPDTDTGSREEFKRVNRAYERLRGE